MKDKKLQKGIEQIRKISLTSEEKRAMLGRIVVSADEVADLRKADSQEIKKENFVASPWTIYSFTVWIRKHRWVPVAAVFLLVILAGNSVVLAANNSLPGDILYPVKVNVVEPIQVAIESTQVGKAEVKAVQLQTRFEEIEALAARGTIHTKSQRDIDSRVEKQKQDLAKSVDAVRATSPDKADDIRTTVEASINAHERILGVLEKKGAGKYTEQDGKTGEQTKKSEPTRATVIAANQASTTAPKNPAYDKKKVELKSRIEKAFTDVTEAESKTSSSPIQKAIVNEAKSKLDQAKNKLQESDDHDKVGESDKSYSDLIESDKATKEADVFIKATTRLEKDMGKKGGKEKETSHHNY